MSTRLKDDNFSGMVTKTGVLDKVLDFTEKALTLRKKRRLTQKMKQQSKHWLRDWAEAILWAVCMVLLINQYLFQMYRIPSGSMSGTLEVGDMIFVNKLVYGPELLPSVGKMPGFRVVKRAEVVVFENPSYFSKGPAFTILKQFMYMISLTLLDIDKDEYGQARVQYLIKRAVALGGDTVKFIDGELFFRFSGTTEWISERDYQKASGFFYPLRRMVTAKDYEQIHKTGKLAALSDMGLPVQAEALKYNPYDELSMMAWRYDELAAAYPHDSRLVAESRRNINGWYIPEGRIFTLGDNRDNSRDARWFGPVSLKKVLGHALFIYWPLNRAGSIH